MPRLPPLPPETTPDLKDHFDFFLGTLGFTPNSVLTMQRKPKLAQALAQLNGAVMDPQGDVDLGFRRLIGHVASKVSGCLYCQAHTLLGAKNFGVSEEKLCYVWTYATSDHYSERERLALDFALAAASQPNAVTDEQFAQLRQHWSDGAYLPKSWAWWPCSVPQPLERHHWHAARSQPERGGRESTGRAGMDARQARKALTANRSQPAC